MRINDTIKEKGQGEFHPALSSCSLMDECPSYAVIKNIACRQDCVNGQKAEMQSASLSGLHFLQAPQAGFEPAFATALKRGFIQLSYRGGLSSDNKTIIFDNISNNASDVKLFVPHFFIIKKRIRDLIN